MSRRRTVWRLRLLTCSLALAAVAFWQRPGLIAADTNLSLALEPARPLGRALQLWQDGHFGHVGGAFGDLFPIGAFFALGDAADIPAWVLQRIWWAALLVAAFLGIVRLAGALGVASPAARIVAGFGYALAPVMLAELTVASAGRWPAAVAPWVLLPLVRAAGGGPPRRNAALSALAVALLGAADPGAVLAVAVLAVCYLLLSPQWRGGWPARGSFAAWWIGAVTLATAWWWAPRLLARPYAAPVLEWSLPASVTTAHASLFNAFRGLAGQPAYAWSGGGEPVLPGGWLLANDPVLIFSSAVAAALGLAGLAMRGAPARPALLSMLVGGVAAVTLGHPGSAGTGPFAEQVQPLLTGWAALARDPASFDVLIRLPLAIGLGYLLSAARWPGWSDSTVRAAALAAASVAVVGSAAPALSGQLARESSFEAVPEHWPEVAEWLAETAPAGRALLVPGAAAGVYQWGTPHDEPLAALARSPWAVRDLAPASSAGNIRLVDAIERRLAAGDGGPALSAALERAGVTHLVVRNDLDYVSTGAPRSLLLHEVVRETPGLTWVGSFGDRFGSLTPPGMVVDSGLDPVFSAVDVFRIGDRAAESRVRLYPLEGSLRLSGGPESLLPLADAGLLEGRAAFVAGDGAEVSDPAPVSVVTDGMRRRAAWYGDVRTNTTEVLRAGDPGPYDSPQRDFLPVDDPVRESVAVVSGVKNVTASSSASHPHTDAVRGAEYSPWAALDGERGTAWLSGEYGFVAGQWLEVEFEAPVDVTTAGISLYDGPAVLAGATSLRVTTDAGSADTEVRPGPATQRLAVPAGPTTRLRVSVVTTEPGTAGQFGIRELAIPGVAVSRALRTPVVQDADLGGPPGPAAVVLAVADGQRGECAPYGQTWRCWPTLARSGEEAGTLDRLVEFPSGDRYELTGQVLGRPGTQLERMIPLDPAGIRAEASSRLIAAPRGWPQSLVDGDPGTSWIAAPDDARPRLELSWPVERAVRGLELSYSPGLAASRPTQLLVTADSDTFLADVGEDGAAPFDRVVRAAGVTVEILSSEPVIDRDPAFGSTTTLPPGISELTVLGAEDLTMPIDLAARAELACGEGPEIHIDGLRVPTAVRATAGDVLAGRPLELRSCSGGGVRLAAGERHVVVGSTPQTRPKSLALTPAGGLGPAGSVPEVAIHSWSPVERILTVAERDQSVLLVVTENANLGWEATLDGEPLAQVRHDGWAQGYIVPPGAAGFVVLSFEPGSLYHEILIAGTFALVAVVVLALLRQPGGTGSRLAAIGPRPEGRTYRLRQFAAAAVFVGALGLLGGPAGLAAAGAAAAAAALAAWRHWNPGLVPAGVAVLGTTAGAAAAVRPWPGLDPGDLSGPAQLFVLGALALALLAPLVRDLTNRLSGVSMNR